MERYSRQIRFPPLGQDGQTRLKNSRVVVMGCGALGSVIAESLVRAGVGFVRLVDRDFLEISNLQRQTLFDEDDVASGLPKAIAAAKRLSKINSTITVQPHVVDVDSSNVMPLVSDVDLILDGSDNFEIRFLINDVAIKSKIPWIYGGCLGADGQMMVILPGQTACLNCLMRDGPPPPGTTETCDSFGILGPVINVVASFQAVEAIKLLSGNRDAINRKLNVFEMWTGEIRQLDLQGLQKQADCPTCHRRQFQWLSGRRESQSVVLCGRNAVQVSFPDRPQIDLKALETKLAVLGKVTSNPFLLKFSVETFDMTVFADGRAIISGTDDLVVAKRLYTQYVGQ